MCHTELVADLPHEKFIGLYSPLSTIQYKYDTFFGFRQRNLVVFHMDTEHPDTRTKFPKGSGPP